MIRRVLPFVVLVIAGLALGSCKSTPKEPEPQWARTEVTAESDDLLWKVILLSLRKMDFPEGADMDRGNMRLATGWRIELSPWKGRGNRRQAVVEAEPIGPRRWRVQARVRMQKNDTLARPMDPTYAEWVWIEDDVSAARIVLQHVRAFLQPELELRPEEVDPVEEYLKRQGG